MFYFKSVPTQPYTDQHLLDYGWLRQWHTGPLCPVIDSCH